MCLLSRNMRLRAFRCVELFSARGCLNFQAIDSLALVVLQSLRHAPRRHCLKSHPKQKSTNWEGLCGIPWQMVVAEMKLTKKVTADKEAAGPPITKDCG